MLMMALGYKWGQTTPMNADRYLLGLLALYILVPKSEHQNFEILRTTLLSDSDNGLGIQKPLLTRLEDANRDNKWGISQEMLGIIAKVMGPPPIAEDGSILPVDMLSEFDEGWKTTREYWDASEDGSQAEDGKKDDC